MKRLNGSLVIFVFFLPLLLPSNSFPITDGTKKSKTIDARPRKIYTSSMFEHWNSKESKQSRTKDGGSGWNYNDPSAWAQLPGSSCGGKNQSPVDLQPRQAVRKAYPKFTFSNYGNIDQIGLVNSGSSAVYTVPNSIPAFQGPYINGGGLNDTFKLIQFHLHWGGDSSKGSEHLIRSKSYPAELHLVHFNTKYKSFNKASAQPDGLAVLGIFLEIGSSDSESFRPLVDQLGEVTDSGTETTLTNLVSLKDLLPRETTSFYRYSGSLTTPNCDEIVIWTVFDNPVKISEKQLNKFRNLKDSEANQLVDNFRPAQQLNGRIKYYRTFTGCEFPQTWPITFNTLFVAIEWARCIIVFALSPQ